jgi:ribosomal protein S27AE
MRSDEAKCPNCGVGIQPEQFEAVPTVGSGCVASGARVFESIARVFLSGGWLQADRADTFCTNCGHPLRLEDYQ